MPRAVVPSSTTSIVARTGQPSASSVMPYPAIISIWPSAVAPPCEPIAGIRNGSAPRAFSSSTTVRRIGAMSAMPRLPPVTAIFAPGLICGMSPSAAIPARIAPGTSSRCCGESFWRMRASGGRVVTAWVCGGAVSGACIVSPTVRIAPRSLLSVLPAAPRETQCSRDVSLPPDCTERNPCAGSFPGPPPSPGTGGGSSAPLPAPGRGWGKGHYCRLIGIGAGMPRPGPGGCRAGRGAGAGSCGGPVGAGGGSGFACVGMTRRVMELAAKVVVKPPASWAHPVGGQSRSDSRRSSGRPARSRAV